MCVHLNMQQAVAKLDRGEGGGRPYARQKTRPGTSPKLLWFSWKSEIMVLLRSSSCAHSLFS